MDEQNVRKRRGEAESSSGLGDEMRGRTTQGDQELEKVLRKLWVGEQRKPRLKRGLAAQRSLSSLSPAGCPWRLLSRDGTGKAC